MGLRVTVDGVDHELADGQGDDLVADPLRLAEVETISGYTLKDGGQLVIVWKNVTSVLIRPAVA